MKIKSYKINYKPKNLPRNKWNKKKKIINNKLINFKKKLKPHIQKYIKLNLKN